MNIPPTNAEKDYDLSNGPPFDSRVCRFASYHTITPGGRERIICQPLWCGVWYATKELIVVGKWWESGRTHYFCEHVLERRGMPVRPWRAEDQHWGPGLPVQQVQFVHHRPCKVGRGRWIWGYRYEKINSDWSVNVSLTDKKVGIIRKAGEHSR